MRLLKHAEEANANLFKAILNPKPILDLGNPPYLGRGTTQELQKYVRDLVLAWQSVPGALDLLSRARPTLPYVPIKFE